jgi:hypothetical protein
MVKNELLHKDADGELVLYAGRSALFAAQTRGTVKVRTGGLTAGGTAKTGGGSLLCTRSVCSAGHGGFFGLWKLKV